MHKALVPVAALLLSVALLLMGNGLQGVLLPVRALLEDFSSLDIGVLGAAYFLGFGAACYLGPLAVRRVGHIRTFAAAVSIAASLILVHGMFESRVVWWLARMATGLCFASLYIVIESWLNERSSNETRGLVFSAYTIVNLTVVTLGQMMLTLSDPGTFHLFALAAILISLATVPVAMTTSQAPAPMAAVRVRPLYLFGLSPVGVVGCLGVGLANGSFWSLAPAFAQQTASGTTGVAVFMSIAVIAGAAGQWPLGLLSDRMDRRRVIVAASIGASLSAVALVVTLDNWMPARFFSVALFGAFAFPLYALCAAHLNDFVAPDGYVEAASGLLLLYAAGAVVGPPVAATFMRLLGADALFLYTAAVHAAVAAYTYYRMQRRPLPEVVERASFGETLVMTQMVTEIDPRASDQGAEANPSNIAATPEGPAPAGDEGGGARGEEADH